MGDKLYQNPDGLENPSEASQVFFLFRPRDSGWSRVFLNRVRFQHDWSLHLMGPIAGVKPAH